MARSRSRPYLAGLALPALLAACGPPEDVVAARGTSTTDAPAPVLLPTENFADALDLAVSDTDRLDTETEALAARAAALQTRAAALSAPVLGPAETTRLESATANPPSITDP